MIDNSFFWEYRNFFKNFWKLEIRLFKIIYIIIVRMLIIKVRLTEIFLDIGKFLKFYKLDFFSNYWFVCGGF